MGSYFQTDCMGSLGLAKTQGSLRSTTATVDENVTSKYNMALALSHVFRDYSVSFTSYNMGKVS